MDYFPSWPLKFNEFLLFGVLLGAGILGGHLAKRTRFLPQISGYIIAGFVLGPSMLSLLDAELVTNARVFTDIALGLILFELGRILNLPELRRNRWLISAGMLESLLSFALIFATLILFGVNALGATIIAALGISSSPAVMLLVIRQLGAKGPVTNSALSLVAMNNVVAFFLFVVILPLLHLEHQASLSTIILQPLYQLLGSLALAYALAHVLLLSAKHLGKHEISQFALVIGIIITTVGLSKMLHLSELLSLLALGILSRNLDKRQALMDVEFGHGGALFFLVLFVVAGANIHVKELLQAGFVAIAFVLARTLAKSLAVYAPLRQSGFTHNQAIMTGLTLTPMAGMAIGLTQVTADMYPTFGRSLSTIVLAAVVILETIGPILTEYALKKAGEVDEDQAANH